MGVNNFNQDSEYVAAVTKTSPNLKRFIQSLNMGYDVSGVVKEFPVDYNFLTRLGCLQTDGEGRYFRILSFYNDRIKATQHGVLRSFDEQQALYSLGRYIGVKEKIGINLIAPEGLRGESLVFTDVSVSKSSDIVTRVAGGASYHNYGLAVDFVLRHYGETVKENYISRIDGIIYDTLDKIYDRAGLLKWARLCHVEWGGSWSSFRDVSHWQDMDFTPLPYVIYGDRCLQNASNCNFSAVEKYYSGKWSAAFADYDRQSMLSLGNVINGSTADKKARWSTWKEGRGNYPLYDGKDGKKGSLIALGLIPLAVLGGFLFFIFGKNSRRRY